MTIRFPSGRRMYARSDGHTLDSMVHELAVGAITAYCRSAGIGEAEIRVYKVPPDAITPQQVFAWIQSVPGISITFCNPRESVSAVPAESIGARAINKGSSEMRGHEGTLPGDMALMDRHIEQMHQFRNELLRDSIEMLFKVQSWVDLQTWWAALQANMICCPLCGQRFRIVVQGTETVWDCVCVYER